jgi:hypothetical protein
MILMMGLLIVVPALLVALPLKRTSMGTAYMAGRTTTEDLHFTGSAGVEKQVQVQNYYLTRFFDEKRLLPAGIIIGAVLLMVMGGISLL